MTATTSYARQRVVENAEGSGHASPLEQALSNALEVWKEWHGRGSWVDGYPGRSPMFAEARCGGLTWDEWEEDADADLARSVQAAVDDLPYVERCAVYATKLKCNYEPTIPLEFAYQTARALLLEVLVRRGAIVE